MSSKAPGASVIESISWPVLLTWTTEVPSSPTTKSVSLSRSYVTDDASLASSEPLGAGSRAGTGRSWRATRAYCDRSTSVSGAAAAGPAARPASVTAAAAATASERERRVAAPLATGRWAGIVLLFGIAGLLIAGAP